MCNKYYKMVDNAYTVYYKSYTFYIKTKCRITIKYSYERGQCLNYKWKKFISKK